MSLLTTPERLAQINRKSRGPTKPETILKRPSANRPEAIKTPAKDANEARRAELRRQITAEEHDLFAKRFIKGSSEPILKRRAKLKAELESIS